VELTVAALVGALTSDRYEVRLPGLHTGAFVGPSVAELLDDAALHLMEHVPKWPAERLHRLVLNPDVRVRRTTVQAPLRFLGAKKAVEVKQKVVCVCTRWPDDGFWRVTVPRIEAGPWFAVRSLSDLTPGLEAWLAERAGGWTSQVLDVPPIRDVYLELVDVEIDLPSVLPSRKPKKKSKKRGKKDGKRPPQEPKKKTWIPARELRGVAVNLVQRALDGRLRGAHGRDALVDDLEVQLVAEGATLLLVGEPGVGKTAIIEAVAQRAAEQARQGGTLQQRTDFWRVDGGRLIAGMSFVGAWESRLARIVEEVHQRDDVLVVDDLPSLCWTGRSAQSETTMADFLLPHLQRGELRILAECTPERLEAGRQRNPGFFASFRIVHVEGMSPLETYRVVLEHLRDVERERGLVAAPELVESIQGLARRFGPRMAEPGRTVSIARRFLGEVQARGRPTDRFGRVRITGSDALRHFGAATGLPDFVLEPGHGQPPADITRWFARRIIGQPEAVDAVTDVVAMLQQALDDPERPVATLLFVGPTGVGKTETAKALAHHLFGDAGRLLRFDMSEVRGPGSLARLVGGAGRPDGDLTRAVANQPFSVVLFDEIEKAGPGVFDLLLQVLGEGRLTNAVGRTTDFSNTVVVMTSNLGVASARRRPGFGSGAEGAADATHFRRAAEAFFRPEFFNRIDRIVPFRALSREDVAPLVSRMVGRVLGRRGLRRSGVIVHFDAPMRDWLAEEGFDPQYGARSLQRVVERELTVPLARHLADRPPTERGAWLDLWRDHGGLQIDYQPLIDAEREGEEADGDEVNADWDALRARYERMVASLERLESAEAWASIVSSRSALLDELNTRAAGGDTTSFDWGQLELASSVVEDRTALLSRLDDFATDWLATYRYEDGYAADVKVDPRGWRADRKQLVTQQEPVPVDRKRTRRAAVAHLERLELDSAAVLHRVRSWGDLRTTVLRFESLHDGASDLAAQLVEAVRAAWAPWRPSRLFANAGSWARIASVDHPASHYALAFRIPGFRELIDGDLGLYLDAEDVGADRVLRLVRVEALVLDRVEDEPILAALRARDAELADARAALRRGEAQREPLPPVVHRFGVLHPGGAAPRLGSTLPDDLRRVALRRVLDPVREG
jgi:ATP-dependent Clp protease ATP-binding subunit ClpC